MLINLSVDDNCMASVGADFIIEGYHADCGGADLFPLGGYYVVELMDANGNVIVDQDPSTPNTIEFDGSPYIDQTFTTKVTEVVFKNNCWGQMFIEDKIAPIMECYDADLTCDEALPTEPAPGTSNSGVLMTTNDANNGNAAGGVVYFDITNSSLFPVTINQIDLSIDGIGQVDIYLTNTTGTYAGNENNAAAWTLAGTANVTAGPFGPGNLASAATSVTIPPGTYGLAVHGVSQGQNYTGVGVTTTPNVYSDGTLTITTGAGTNGLFAGAVFMIRSFNGGLHYSQNIPQVVPYDACGAVTVTYEDTVVDNGCSTDFYEIITRVWTATDPSGNSTSCTSTYRLIRPTLVDVTFPAHIDLDCSEDPNDLSLTGTPSGASCGGNIEFSSEDHVVDICEGSYKVLRTWTALDYICEWLCK